MYRRLEPKPGKIVATEPTPKGSCKCSCTREQPKDGKATPEVSQINAYNADYFNING
jgi:hypothetical protein